jgi:hypothetical protein
MQEDHSSAVSQLIGCPAVYRGHEKESSGPVSTFFIFFSTFLFNKVCMATTDIAGSLLLSLQIQI